MIFPYKQFSKNFSEAKNRDFESCDTWLRLVVFVTHWVVFQIIWVFGLLSFGAESTWQIQHLVLRFLLLHHLRYFHNLGPWNRSALERLVYTVFENFRPNCQRLFFFVKSFFLADSVSFLLSSRASSQHARTPLSSCTRSMGPRKGAVN